MAKQANFVELKLIGDRLRELRKKQGYSNYEHIAYELGMSRSAYFRIESGENFELKTLIKICRLLGLTLTDFFEGVDFPRQVRMVKKTKGRSI